MRWCLELRYKSVDGNESRGSLKGLKDVLTILEVGEGFPCCIVKRVSFPFHEVLSSRAMVTLLENCFHLILWFSINDDGWREGMRLAGCVERGWVMVWEEFAHMEHVVDAHV